MRNSRRPDAADPLSAVSGTRAGSAGDSPELAALIEVLRTSFYKY
jgi:hypothetical protein